MESGPTSIPARTISVVEPVRNYIELTLEAPEIARRARPGQFVMVRGWPGADPFLPRPFDLVRADPASGRIVLFVKVEGRGTNLLSALEPERTVQCTGPLGRAVEIAAGVPIALLVRGAGAAAGVMLASLAAGMGVPIYTYLSASTAARIVCREYLEPVSTELEIATDDGSGGYRGNATDLLDRLVDREAWRSGSDGSPGRVYTCGSRRFARHVRTLEQEGRARGFVFLEGLMACGMGDCHGCAVRKAGQPGYYLVCRDGPLFPVGKVVLD